MEKENLLEDIFGDIKMTKKGSLQNVILQPHQEHAVQKFINSGGRQLYSLLS